MDKSSEERIIAAIKEAVDENTRQHEEITRIATISGELSNTIQRGLDAMAGFQTTTGWFGKLLMMGGMLYLIFEEPIHRIFN